METKDDHNIPKDLDKIAKKPKPNTSSIVVGGELKKQKKSFIKNIRWSKKIAVLLVLCVVIFSFGVVVIIYLVNKSEPPVATDTAENDLYIKRSQQLAQNAEAEKRQRVATPLAKDASSAEKSFYYTEALSIKFKEGDNQKTSEYYVTVVKPQKVELGLDTKESIVAALLKSTYRQEAKPLVSEIISSYRAKPNVDDVAVKAYVEQKLNSYVALEKTL